MGKVSLVKKTIIALIFSVLISSLIYFSSNGIEHGSTQLFYLEYCLFFAMGLSIVLEINLRSQRILSSFVRITLSPVLLYLLVLFFGKFLIPVIYSIGFDLYIYFWSFFTCFSFLIILGFLHRITFSKSLVAGFLATLLSLIFALIVFLSNADGIKIITTGCAFIAFFTYATISTIGKPGD